METETKIIDGCRYERLTVEKLNTLSTKRLLALLKGVRRYTSFCGYLIGVEGDESMRDVYEFYGKYYLDIKDILKDRPHIERKKKNAQR